MLTLLHLSKIRWVYFLTLFIDLFVYSFQIPCCLDYCSFTVGLEVRECQSSDFVFLYLVVLIYVSQYLGRSSHILVSNLFSFSVNCQVMFFVHFSVGISVGFLFIWKNINTLWGFFWHSSIFFKSVIHLITLWYHFLMSFQLRYNWHITWISGVWHNDLIFVYFV